MTGKTAGTIPNNGEGIELETAVIYKIGKTTVSIDRVFRENAVTIGDIIITLIKKEAEKH